MLRIVDPPFDVLEKALITAYAREQQPDYPADSLGKLLRRFRAFIASTHMDEMARQEKGAEYTWIIHRVREFLADHEALVIEACYGANQEGMDWNGKPIMCYAKRRYNAIVKLADLMVYTLPDMNPIERFEIMCVVIDAKGRGTNINAIQKDHGKSKNAYYRAKTKVDGVIEGIRKHALAQLNDELQSRGIVS